MNYKRFEDLPVWQAAADMAAKMFVWTGDNRFHGKGDLANQLQRATLSISNNIAEGFERGTTSELLAFLYYARGSAGEVRSMLSIVERMDGFASFKQETGELRSQCESISRQLRGWVGSLQNCDIAGQRHLNDQSRQSYQQRKKGEVMLQQQRQFMEQKKAELEEAARQREVERQAREGPVE